jgi:pullulanase/glycogen debranching enzyme
MMKYMNEKLGAWQVGDGEKSGKAQFRIFFPKEDTGLQHNIKSIQVCGDFQKALGQAKDWEPSLAPAMTRSTHPEGEIWEWQTPKELPKDFYQYKYHVTFNDNSTRWVSDPCTRYGGEDNMNAAFVIGGSQPSDNIIAPIKGDRKPLRDLVIYELMIDDFTSEFRGKRAPLDAMRDKLDHIQDCGFNAILFMPWTAWNDDKFNWGYTPALYYSVEYRYANDLNHPEEKLFWLKKLINECHLRGIHVIMDGVFNHVYTGFPYKAFYQSYDKDCPYTGQFYGEFPGLQDLDFNHTCTQEFIFDVCRYWIEEFKIDGIRFDNTVNFYNRGDNKGLPKLLKDIDDLVHQKGESNFSLTLEHLQMDAVEVTKTTHANSYWDNALYGECFGGLWDRKIKPSLLNALNNNYYLLGTGKVPTIYLGNHDHADVAWQAGAKHNAGALEWYSTQPYLIAMLTAPGGVLIKNGQEFAEDYWIPEDDKGSSRRVQPRPLHWDYPKDKFGKALGDVYTKLIKLRHNYEVLRADGFYPERWEEWQTRFNPVGVGIDTERHLLVYRRYCVDSQNKLRHAVVVLNFSDNEQWLDLTFPENGQWIDLLAEPSWTITVTNYHYGLGIGSNWGHIFYNT